MSFFNRQRKDTKIPKEPIKPPVPLSDKAGPAVLSFFKKKTPGSASIARTIFVSNWFSCSVFLSVGCDTLVGAQWGIKGWWSLPNNIFGYAGGASPQRRLPFRLRHSDGDVKHDRQRKKKQYKGGVRVFACVNVFVIFNIDIPSVIMVNNVLLSFSWSRSLNFLPPSPTLCTILMYFPFLCNTLVEYEKGRQRENMKC